MEINVYNVVYKHIYININVYHNVVMVILNNKMVY